MDKLYLSMFSQDSIFLFLTSTDLKEISFPRSRMLNIWVSSFEFKGIVFEKLKREGRKHINNWYSSFLSNVLVKLVYSWKSKWIITNRLIYIIISIIFRKQFLYIKGWGGTFSKIIPQYYFRSYFRITRLYLYTQLKTKLRFIWSAGVTL